MNTRELAKQLKVSQTTVVLALKNHPSISEKTRKRIQDAAAKAGYRKNALVSALMAQVAKGRKGRIRGEVLAFFSAEQTEDGWQKYIMAKERVDALRSYAKHLGFRLEHFWLGANGALAHRVSSILKARAIRGGIILSLPRQVTSLSLDWNLLPIVALGYASPFEYLHQACANHFEGIRSCYQNLRALGYKRISLFLHPIDDIQTRYRWTAGFSVCPKLYGGDPIPFESLPWPSDAEAEPKFLEWFKRVKPDAIIGTNPNFPLHWLAKAGLHAPKDFGYASLDIPTGQLGEIAGIRENHPAIAAALIDLLVEQLNANHYGCPSAPKLVELHGTWTSGASATPRKAFTE